MEKVLEEEKREVKKRILVLGHDPNIVEALNKATEDSCCIFRSDNFYSARRSSNDIMVVTIPVLINDTDIIKEIAENSKVIILFSALRGADVMNYFVKNNENIFIVKDDTRMAQVALDCL